MGDTISNDERALLERYAVTRDADAFAGLTNRYAPMVFAVAYRVTGSRHDAEDIAQACFLELARKASQIRTSIAGWLHSLATHRARNLLRDQHLRRRRENEAAVSDAADDGPPWSEIEPRIDAALDSLPEKFREPLVSHYLRGLNQSEVALELGLSQATVSRRLERGVELLRAGLKNGGLGCSIVALHRLLPHAQSAEVPAGLRESLGKLALAGPKCAAPPARIASITMPRTLILIGTVAIGTIVWHVGFDFVSTPGRILAAPPLQWGAPRDGNTTFIGALAAAARAYGANSSYRRMMGDSGLAFSVRWCRGGSATEPNWLGLPAFGDGDDERRLIETSLGIRLLHLARFGPEQTPAGQYAFKIANVLRSGSPLVTQGEDRIVCGLILGQGTWDRRRLLIQRYGMATPTWDRPDSLGGLVAVENGDKPARDRRHAILAALRHAILEWERAPREGGTAGSSWVEDHDTIFYGEEAFKEWMNDTRRSVDLPERLARQIWKASWWNYDVYCDSRYQAANYLREASAEFPGKAAEALIRAAKQFERLQAEELVDSVYLKAEGPWTQKTFTDWTPTTRQAEIEVFTQALAIDRQAQRELRAAVRKIDVLETRKNLHK